MIKPTSFRDLPYALQESLLWEFNLDYCPYESSKVEAVHSIQCNYPYDGSINDLVIRSSYAQVSVERLESRARRHLSSLESQIKDLKKMIDAK